MLTINATEVDDRYIETNSIGLETKYGKVVEVNFIPAMTGSYTLIVQDQDGKRTSYNSRVLFEELYTENVR